MTAPPRTRRPTPLARWLGNLVGAHYARKEARRALRERRKQARKREAS